MCGVFVVYVVCGEGFQYVYVMFFCVAYSMFVCVVCGVCVPYILCVIFYKCTVHCIFLCAWYVWNMSVVCVYLNLLMQVLSH